MATQGLALWSKTAANNSSADPAVNWAEGMAPSAVNDSARGMMASVAKWRDDLYGLTTAGTSTAFTVTTNATYASASDMSGAVICIIPHTTSGSSPTLAVDGLTARAINVSTGVAIPTGALVSGTPYFVKYVHASTEFILCQAEGKTLLSALDIISGTSETSIATGDTLPIYDLSATANRRMLVSDFLKVINALTADASPNAAADYVMTYDASASGVKKVLLQNIPVVLPRGYIDGLTLSNGTDTTNDINIAAGTCRDSTNTVNITISTAMGKQLDANWAAGGTTGSPAGMRNSAAGIADTTYHIYAVSKADGTADVYAHTSTTVATVLSALQAESGGASYLYARRIGSIVRRSAAIQQFTQGSDGFFRMKTPTLDVSDTGLSTTFTNYTLASVPNGLSLRVHLNIALSHSSATRAVIIQNPSDTQTLPDTSAAPLGSARSKDGVMVMGQVTVVTNTSAQISAAADGGSTTLQAAVLGWWDTRLV